MGNSCTKAPATTDGESSIKQPALPCTTFTRKELVKATNGFSDSNLLGKGGFGSVHKGDLEDGTQVAIKQLKDGSKQGDREFLAEVEIISRVHHRNLVSLVGCCIEEGARMLVYEFLPNNTLSFHLHGGGQPTMDWHTRQKIALGIAKGLEYLHEDCDPKIIHRDIKAENILLNKKFEAKIADFGLAIIFPDDHTHVEASRLMGTIGYLDPRYALNGKLTEKSDVYSFGVILMELVTGKKPVCKRDEVSSMSHHLKDWVLPLMENHNYNNVADPLLQGNYNADDFERILKCAAACVKEFPRSRPQMKQVVRVLEGDSIDSLKVVVAPTRSIDYPDLQNAEKSEFQKAVEMSLQDGFMEKTEDEKTALEAYVDDMRNKLDDKYKDFVTASEREEFSATLKEVEDWLHEGGKDESKGVYIAKLEELKKQGDLMEERYKENSEEGGVH